MKRGLIAISLGLLALTGCGKQDETGAGKSNPISASTKTNKPLNEALAETSGFSTMGHAIKDTGLAGVFDGKAHYTLLAPTDAAFANLGERGAALQQPQQRAALAAFVRAHIVPGDLTADDIGKALDKAGGKPVKLHAMDKATLSLARDGGKVIVTAPDGAKAALVTPSVKARNGSVIGLDGVLKKLT